MGRFIIVFIICITSYSSFGQSQNIINTIREELFFTDFNIEKCNSFYAKLTALERVTPTVTAYEAAAKALIAKHSWNPVTKIMSLKESLKLLDQAVSNDKINAEIRFIRLYIENSIPPYLGVKKNTEEDSEIIRSQISKIHETDLNPDIVSYIQNYMNHAESQATSEVRQMKSASFN